MTVKELRFRNIRKLGFHGKYGKFPLTDNIISPKKNKYNIRSKRKWKVNYT